jgi:hypothetical protein
VVGKVGAAMNANALLECLKASGLSCRVDGGRLLVSPAEKVTDAIRQLVKPLRDELIALLTELPPLERFVSTHTPRAGIEILIELPGGKYRAVSAAQYALAMGDAP